MKRFGLVAAAGMGMGLSLWMTACGGGTTPPPPPATYVLTVNSVNPASGVAITVSPADASGAANGTTSFTRSYAAGTSVTLTAPSTSGGNTFTSWSGCTSTSNAACTAAMNTSMTVTANYAVPALIMPTVTVTPSATSITTAQALTVTISVTVPSGNPTPAGTVALSGSYTSPAATLSGGSATIIVAARVLPAGNDTLTVTYMPNLVSSLIYGSASGSAVVTVTAAAILTPTVTVTPSATIIASTQAWTVAVAVSGGSGAAAPTGSVTMTSGSYTSTAATLSGGSATINVPAGSMASGTDTLTVTYTPDAASSSIYNSASGTASVTVPAGTSYVVTVNSVNPSSGVPIQTICTAPACPAVSLPPFPTPFTLVAEAGESFALLAPATAGVNTFEGWSGCIPTPGIPGECNVTVNGAMTVTAIYVTLKTPTVTVTPSPASITTAQALTVTVGVSGGSGNPTPTGSVTLTSGSYTSAAATLSAGSATINVAAGALAAGSDTLTVSYTPDTASSSIYNGATGTAPETVTGVSTYTLTIDSTAPASGVDIQAIPADINNNGYGPTPLTLTYNPGTAVALTAPTTSGGYAFLSWTGCATSTATGACTVTMNANTTVTANYNKPSVTSITVTPTTATIGIQVQFKAAVAGTGSYSSAVSWALSCPVCGSLSSGTLTPGGLYTTPYPAPASVTVTATSAQQGYTNVSGSATVTLSPPATATGPVLSVDASSQTHAISPYIYGMNNYALETSVAKDANITVVRWGGDNTSRYNYQTNTTNSASDYYFENGSGAGGMWPDGNFNDMVTDAATYGIRVLGTVPVLGWVTNSSTTACSFLKSTYPNQESYNGQCGDGVDTGGADLYGNSTIAALTSISEPAPAPPAASAATTSWADATWTGGWVNYLVGKFGAGNPATGTGKGVAEYDLDNEPAWWDAVHRDVHPVASTYDEVTNGGIGTALAIKIADPTALVNGPVIDNWWNYFYSKKDMEAGWGTGPCLQPWDSPADRTAKGGVPFIQYYLSQFAQAETTYGKRLLDYLDLHTYFAAEYPTNSGNGVGSATAGDTGAQQARLNSTRVFWDPTYTDASGQFPQPNYSTDPNYYNPAIEGNCSVPQQAPQLIPMMKAWVTGTAGSYAGYFYPGASYPGTKTAITEYSWGGQESINGALAQADILGIFGREGLDLGTLWGPPDPSTEMPGLMAFEIYRNYDGNKSTFGDTALASASANQGTLAVYGALRSSDNAVTVVVINKTYGPLTSTLSIPGLSTTSTTAQVFLYSNANLNAIVAQPAATVTPPTGGVMTSTISNYTFPAQSITLFVVPQ